MANGISIRRFSFRRALHYHFIEKKLNTVYGFIFLTLLITPIVFAMALIDPKLGFAGVVLLGGVMLVILVLRYPYFGFYFFIVLSSLCVTIDRMISTPVPSGIFVEVFSYLTLLSILLKYDLKKNINIRFYTNPITICIYILFAYYVIELFNPEMRSWMGWLSYVRKQFSYFVFFYICYCLFDSKERIIYFIRFVIALSSLLALYACKQQWFGYADFELRYIGTGRGYALLMQGGLLRKFSVFSDPGTSGILFASISILCVILIFRGNNKKERNWLFAALVCNVLGYTYSGTRTATLMIVVGIVMYCISAIFERRTVILLAYSIGVYLALMFMPWQNPATMRIRSTFEGTKDQSAAIRDYDRHEVQPYIQAHPLGGGIFTVGAEGTKYNAGVYLELLQADSGYMKTMAEQGVIGFALLLFFYFVIMRVGYRHFYRVKDPEIKSYYIGLLILMFTLMVAQYAQMTISLYPLNLYFYAITIIFIKLADYDRAVLVKKTIQT